MAACVCYDLHEEDFFHLWMPETKLVVLGRFNGKYLYLQSSLTGPVSIIFHGKIFNRVLKSLHWSINTSLWFNIRILWRFIEKLKKYKLKYGKNKVKICKRSSYLYQVVGIWKNTKDQEIQSFYLEELIRLALIN